MAITCVSRPNLSLAHASSRLKFSQLPTVLPFAPHLTQICSAQSHGRNLGDEISSGHWVLMVSRPMPLVDVAFLLALVCKSGCRQDHAPRMPGLAHSRRPKLPWTSPFKLNPKIRNSTGQKTWPLAIDHAPELRTCMEDEITCDATSS